MGSSFSGLNSGPGLSSWPMLRSRLKRLALLLLLLAICFGVWRSQRLHRSVLAEKEKENRVANLISPELLGQFTAIEQRENRVDETTWAPERRAEQCGEVFENLWDELKNSSNSFDVLANFPVGQLLLSQYGPGLTVIDNVQLNLPVGPDRSWQQQEWQNFLNGVDRDGWHLEHIEFRQRAFDPAQGAEPEHSRFSFRADLAKTNGLQRATLEGDLMVKWTNSVPGSPPAVAQIDARQLSIRSRDGQSAFLQVLNETIQPPEKSLFIDPLILYDLDGDGISEIILAAKNLVYHRQPGGQYQPGPLCKYDPGRIFTAVIADFDGDGVPDFLCAKPEGLFLFHGSASGKFDDPGRLVWAANPPLKYAQVLTCGDVDQDGDLDIFLGQYKTPYFHGQMPTPYFNANDGDPSYLLLNDGHGKFSDVTEASGLGKNRWRRSYSGSFVRIRSDGYLDLVTVSDFAGIDLYRNDGHGHFSEVTGFAFPEFSGFGMAHAFCDFNRDGLLDFLMVGMDSPAVDRLEHLGLWRQDASEDRRSRVQLAAGNRLFLSRPDGTYEATSLSSSIAHSGWSWGCGAADFDNDGYPDVYIANGHESRAMVKDYEPEFWMHDIYVAGSTNNRAAELYFQSKFTRTRGRGQSYGGYEQNRCYLNLGGTNFLEAGYLLGVGLEQDCRNVVADDLDGDGRMDLLVTTFEVWPSAKQTLRVYENRLLQTGNWIGFRFSAARSSALTGTLMTIHYGTNAAAAELVTGDSYRSQTANTLHFGLGHANHVDWAEVVWADGGRDRIERPAINQYNNVRRGH